VILPPDFDLAEPDDVLIARLVESGCYETEEEAEDVVGLLRDAEAGRAEPVD